MTAALPYKPITLIRDSIISPPREKSYKPACISPITVYESYLSSNSDRPSGNSAPLPLVGRKARRAGGVAGERARSTDGRAGVPQFDFLALHFELAQVSQNAFLTKTTGQKRLTYHLANPRQRSRVARNQRSTVVGMIRGSDGDGVRDDDVRPVPSSRHSATECIEKALGFSGNALPAAGLALVRLANRRRLAGFQGTDVKSVQWRDRVGERGSVGGGEGRGEGEELEGLDARDRDDVIVGWFGLLRFFGVNGGSVDGDEVCDRTGCEQRSFHGSSCRLRRGDAHSMRRERLALRSPGPARNKTHRAPIAPLNATSSGTMADAIPGPVAIEGLCVLTPALWLLFSAICYPQGEGSRQIRSNQIPTIPSAETIES